MVGDDGVYEHEGSGGGGYAPGFPGADGPSLLGPALAPLGPCC